VLDGLLFLTILICLITDLKERKIYNAILIPTLFLGFLFNFVESGFLGLLTSGKGFLIGLGFLLLPFIGGGIGAGDVKLLATIGAIKGPQFVFYTCLGMGLTGGIIAIGILIIKGSLLKLLKKLGPGLWLAFVTRFKVVDFTSDQENSMFPYGIAITLGVVSAYLVG